MENTGPAFTRTFRVRSYEENEDGAVHHAVFLQWFQEAAFDASAALGFDQAWYAKMEAAWVMRGMEVEFLAPARYGDQVAVKTWVSDFRRVRSHRDYEARRVSDDALLARAQGDWVFLDRRTLNLRRVDPEIVNLFAPFGAPAIAPIEWQSLSAGASLGHFESTRRVQHYEIDPMHHVNNANYLFWIEEQARAAWLAWGREPAALQFHRHKIEYRQAAVSGDNLHLVSDAARVGDEIVWQQRILRGDTVLIEARSR